MLKSLVLILTLAGTLLTASIAVNAQSSQKENSSFSYSREEAVKDFICKKYRVLGCK